MGEQAEAQAAPTGSETGDKTLAAVAYILTWLTGIIVYVISDDDDKYARWHAIQAIGLGVVLIIFWFIISAISGALAFGAASGGVAGTGAFLGFGLLIPIFWLISLLAILFLAYKAYKGEKVRIPVVADLADDHA